MSGYEDSESQFRFGHDRITWSVQVFILVNVVVFACQLLAEIPLGFLPGDAVPGGMLVDWLAFSPPDFVHGYLWLPLTYMFLHSGLSHLFFNMLMLYFFGPEVERVLGTRQFVRFYLLCGALGVLGNLLPILLAGANSHISVVGASGATLGVLVAFAMVEPDRRVFLFPLPIPINARALVIIIVVMNLMAGLGSETSASVATHFGGMITGFLYMKYRPYFAARRARRRWGRKKTPTDGDLNKLGEEIDNIFKFQDRHKK